MGKSHLFGHPAGIMNIQPGAAGALLGQGRAVVVKLQRDADDVIALLGQLRGHDRAVDAARHRHHHAGVGGGLGESKRIEAGVEGHEHLSGGVCGAI